MPSRETGGNTSRPYARHGGTDGKKHGKKRQTAKKDLTNGGKIDY